MNRLIIAIFLSMSWIPPSAAAAPPRIQPTLAGTVSKDVHELSPVFFGFNLKFTRKSLWGDSKWESLVKELHPAAVRYPGGAAANYWDWRASKLTKPSGKGPEAIHSLDQLSAGLKRVGGAPVFCVNMVTSTVEEQIEMLKTAEKKGLKIRFIELGNEFYLRRYRNDIPNAKSYAKLATRWITEMKPEFPQARFAVVGALTSSGSPDRKKEWNRQLSAHLKGADAITFHPYIMSGFSSGPRAKRGKTPPAQIRLHHEKLRSSAELEKFFAKPFQRIQGMRSQADIPAGLTWWLTEYNMHEKEGPVAGSWAQGLALAALTLEFVSEPRVEMALFHQLEGSPAFSAIYHRAYPIRHLEGVRVKPMTYSPTGHVLSMIGAALHERPLCQSIHFNQEKTEVVLDDGGRVEYPSVSGRMFSDPKKQHRSVILLNLSADAVTADITDAKIEKGTVVTMRAEPSDLIIDPSLPSRTTLPYKGIVDLPPYSITSVTAH